VELRPGLSIDENAFVELCKSHGVKSMALFGSTLRDDFNSSSDIDFLVEFLPDRPVGMLEVAEFELQLSQLLGNREVEIRTPRDLSSLFREEVQRHARPMYEAA
jgi:uncharacterized protein